MDFIGIVIGAIPAAILCAYVSCKKPAYGAPVAIWAICFLLGLVAVLFGLSNSTDPSFAQRVIAVGNVSRCAVLHSGKGGSTYGFDLRKDDGGLVSVETHIKAPICRAGSSGEVRRYRVVYLRDGLMNLENEAISVEVLTGDNRGWQGNLDARPFGFWLFMPFGAFLLYLGYYGFKNFDVNRKVLEPVSN